MTAIVRKEFIAVKSKEKEKESRSRRAYLNNLLARTQKAIAEKDITLARHYYNQTKNMYNSLPPKDKKGYYNRIVKLFSDIGRLK